MVFTGKIDEYYGYQFGKLEYRTVTFEDEVIDSSNYQGNAVVNYTERAIPYARVIEHKHFEFGTQPRTVNDLSNERLYDKCEELAKREQNVMFGGRLAQYKFPDCPKTQN